MSQTQTHNRMQPQVAGNDTDSKRYYTVIRKFTGIRNERELIRALIEAHM